MPRTEADIAARPSSAKIRRYGTSGFFVLRTPLLPYDEYERWGKGLGGAGHAEATELAAPGIAPETERFGATKLAAAGQAESLLQQLDADRTVLRGRLRDLFQRPSLREALFLASPSLHAELDGWLANPEREKTVELALVRYFTRMACRPTPFGLFAGCTVGECTPDPQSRGPRERGTSFVLTGAHEYIRRTRLDMDYLSRLATALAEDLRVRPGLEFRPNSSLYLAAGRLRYAESGFEGKARSYRLVAVEPSPPLLAILARAANGATIEELVPVVLEAEPDVDATEAAEFIDELIASQILVSELEPLLTGEDPLVNLTRHLAKNAGGLEIAQRLTVVQDRLADLDRSGVGTDVDRYGSLAALLRQLPAEPELARTFQVDLVKPPVQVTLGARVIEELLRSIDVLGQASARFGFDPLARFREAFLERYELREVPLVEVLDEEIGIGFQRSDSPSAEGSPLLEGLDFASLGSPRDVNWTSFHSHWLRRVTNANARGLDEIPLTVEDLQLSERSPTPVLPDAFSVVAMIEATGPDAIDRGEYRLYLQAFGGPSGARLLGRFCDADRDLADAVGKHLRAEEAWQPSAIFAEIVHLPEGRIGNILFRPLLREYEIPFLGRSGTPPDRQIPMADLLVSVRNERVILRSRRLGIEIVPRLTTAHNFTNRGLGLYKFLGFLQSQGVVAGGGWDWGPLASFPFLPRITTEHTVLSLARWRLDRAAIAKLERGRDDELYRAVDSLRRERRIPRWVEFVDGDNLLLLDLENVFCLEVLANLVRRRESAILRERFPRPDRLLAQGSEGRFVHELVVPLVRLAPHHAASETPDKSGSGSPMLPGSTEERVTSPTAVVRAFPPGSEWLYAKLYTGASNADRLLREWIGPLARNAIESGAAQSWFFIRFADPEWHLRLRFRGDPKRLAHDVLPALHDRAAQLMEQGLLWRLQLDTYVRETERYGGEEAIQSVEDLFFVDSEAVLAIVELLSGDEGADARWRLAFLGIDRLFSDLGIDVEEREKLAAALRDRYFREFSVTPSFRKRLGETYRRERKGLEALLGSDHAPDHPLFAGIEILERRSRAARSACSRLREVSASRRLQVPLEDLAGSLAHMHANRLLRTHGRAQELVVYDLLARCHESRRARNKPNVNQHAGTEERAERVGELDRRLHS